MNNDSISFLIGAGSPSRSTTPDFPSTPNVIFSPRYVHTALPTHSSCPSITGAGTSNDPITLDESGETSLLDLTSSPSALPSSSTVQPLSLPVSPASLATLPPPLVVSQPIVTTPSQEGREGLLTTSPGLTRRRSSQLKRQRKTSSQSLCPAADSNAKRYSPPNQTSLNLDLSTNYKPGDFGRQARALLRSSDKHGMLSPRTHGVVKPAVVLNRSYKKDHKVAERMARRKARKHGGLFMETKP